MIINIYSIIKLIKWLHIGGNINQERLFDQVIIKKQKKGNWFELKDKKVFRKRENDMQKHFKARQ